MAPDLVNHSGIGAEISVAIGSANRRWIAERSTTITTVIHTPVRKPFAHDVKYVHKIELTNWQPHLQESS